MSSIKSYNQISVRLLKLNTEAEMDTVNSLPRFLQPDSPKNHELNSSQVNLNLIFVLPSVLAYCRLEVKRQWNLLLSQMNFSLD